MISIVPFTEDKVEEVKSLTDDIFGETYLTLEELKEDYKISWKGGICSSFLMYDNKRLIGVRVTHAPGTWDFGSCLVDEWGVDSSKVAYFQTIGVHSDYSGKGLGQELLDASIEASKRQGAIAGVANIWVNSPHNSAYRYFSKAGGKVVNIKHNHWRGQGCILCGPSCDCIAAEMIIHF